jgi:predicted transcriptional regulator
VTRKQKQVVYRRLAVFSLLVKGTTNTYEMAEALGISQSTVSRDTQFLKVWATEQAKSHVNETLPWTYRICSEGISQAWSLIVNKDAKVNKVAVLSLIEQCYKDRLEISTNAFVITQALEQVTMMKEQIRVT